MTTYYLCEASTPGEYLILSDDYYFLTCLRNELAEENPESNFFICTENIMQKIKDFESFAAGYFIGRGKQVPTGEDVAEACTWLPSFAAALAFYMANDTRVMAKKTFVEKYEQVASNIRALMDELP